MGFCQRLISLVLGLLAHNDIIQQLKTLNNVLFGVRYKSIVRNKLTKNSSFLFLFDLFNFSYIVFYIIFVLYFFLYRMSTGHPAAKATTKLFTFRCQASQPGFFFQIWMFLFYYFLCQLLVILFIGNGLNLEANNIILWR